MVNIYNPKSMRKHCKGYLARTRALLTAISETMKVRSALFYVCETFFKVEVIAVNE